jgi:hypothetical protein
MWQLSTNKPVVFSFCAPACFLILLFVSLIKISFCYLVEPPDLPPADRLEKTIFAAQINIANDDFL